jgi:hypothetical protein
VQLLLGLELDAGCQPKASLVKKGLKSEGKAPILAHRLSKAFARYPSFPGGNGAVALREGVFYASRHFSARRCLLHRCCCRGQVQLAPQSQAATSAPKPSTIDIIKWPSLLRQKLAGNNCQTTRQWIGGRQFCKTYCF